MHLEHLWKWSKVDSQTYSFVNGLTKTHLNTRCKMYEEHRIVGEMSNLKLTTTQSYFEDYRCYCSLKEMLLLVKNIDGIIILLTLFFDMNHHN